MGLGVKKKYRNLGIELLLSYKTVERIEELGMLIETSWTLEDNDLINKVIEEMGGIFYKKYRIYEMNI